MGHRFLCPAGDPRVARVTQTSVCVCWWDSHSSLQPESTPAQDTDSDGLSHKGEAGDAVADIFAGWSDGVTHIEDAILAFPLRITANKVALSPVAANASTRNQVSL
jgi:hypothetical protein